MTEFAALRAFARMMNTANADAIEPALHDAFQYESQYVFSCIKSKQDYLDCIRPKLQPIGNSSAQAFAELGEINAYGRNQPCVVLAQNDRENLVAIVIAKMRDDLLARLDLLATPPRHAAKRSGEYPH